MEKMMLKNIEVELCGSYSNPETYGVLFWYKGMAMHGTLDRKTFEQLKQWETIGEPLR